MLLNLADADLFNSHVSYGNKGIHHKHSICIRHSEQDGAASAAHRAVFITLIILRCFFPMNTFITRHLSESSVAEPLMSAPVVN